MVPLGGLHGERDRAEFGSAAERYDRYRPGYPSALIDELMSLNPTSALDVGRGTGKVALSLTGGGLPVPRGRARRSHGRVQTCVSTPPAARGWPHRGVLRERPRRGTRSEG